MFMDRNTSAAFRSLCGDVYSVAKFQIQPPHMPVNTVYGVHKHSTDTERSIITLQSLLCPLVNIRSSNTDAHKHPRTFSTKITLLGVRKT